MAYQMSRFCAASVKFRQIDRTDVITITLRNDP